ncbi:MAG: methylmalonyl Co-A mutase-associated GTPase MeaB [Rhodothermales bacterium]|nr:methylmalonyl Co-A mutase-associated GTPase MeaB [Rhodothermales bacterium]
MTDPNVEAKASEIAAEVRSGDRVALAKAITLIESSSSAHTRLAEAVLDEATDAAADSIRIGFSGMPGAGKSTLIEKLGVQLIARGHRVAVLAVDPSSTESGGSVLGDKTRMEALSREPNAFIRPTPSRGSLGGVSARTREAITLCEAAGYDVILVETVGVGQSEADVARLTDLVFLLVLSGAGDDLQGIKRGVIEHADVVLVGKADGENIMSARQSVGMYRSVLDVLRKRDSGWNPKVVAVSGVTGTGVDELWQLVEEYRRVTGISGFWQKKREDQLGYWLRSSLVTEIQHRISASSAVAYKIADLEKAVRAGEMTPRSAARQLLRSYIQSETEANTTNRADRPQP